MHWVAWWVDSMVGCLVVKLVALMVEMWVDLMVVDLVDLWDEQKVVD